MRLQARLDHRGFTVPGGVEHYDMLRIDVSSLRPSELRSLLANARARGNVALAEQFEAELAARAARRAPAALPIGGPYAAPDAEPPFENDDVLPIDVGPPIDDFALEFSRPRRAPNRWPVAALVAAGLVTAGAALAWTLAGAPGPPRGESPPAAAPVSASTPPRTALRAMTVRPEPIAPPATAAPSAVEPLADPEPPPVVAKAEPARPARLDPCAAPPAPADRLLCRDLALNLLEHEMREAYGRAITSGADPIALRDSQAAWRRTRDPIADPHALAAAYDRRIRELESTAEPSPP